VRGKEITFVLRNEDWPRVQPGHPSTQSVVTEEGEGLLMPFEQEPEMDLPGTHEQHPGPPPAFLEMPTHRFSVHPAIFVMRVDLPAPGGPVISNWRNRYPREKRHLPPAVSHRTAHCEANRTTWLPKCGQADNLGTDWLPWRHRTCSVKQQRYLHNFVTKFKK